MINTYSTKLKDIPLEVSDKVILWFYGDIHMNSPEIGRLLRPSDLGALKIVIDFKVSKNPSDVLANVTAVI